MFEHASNIRLLDGLALNAAVHVICAHMQITTMRDKDGIDALFVLFFRLENDCAFVLREGLFVTLHDRKVNILLCVAVRSRPLLILLELNLHLVQLVHLTIDVDMVF